MTNAPVHLKVLISGGFSGAYEQILPEFTRTTGVKVTTGSGASQETFRDVAKALEATFGEPRKAQLTWKPQNTVAVDDDQGEKLLKLIDTLNDSDDVQNVYANFEISDALMLKMSA